MALVRVATQCIALSILCVTTAYATPVTTAAAILKEAQAVLKSAEKAKKKVEKNRLTVRGLKKVSRAYLLLVTNKLGGTAPQLFAEIQKQIAQLSDRPEIVEARGALRLQAIEAAASGKMVDAYDKFAALRALDPRDKTVQYVLDVIGRRMDGKQ